MANLRLKKHMLEAVENQLKANELPFVKEVYLQLQSEGIPKKQCKEMIAAVLLGVIYEVMKFGRLFNEEHYKEELYGLVYYEDDWDELDEDETLSTKRHMNDAKDKKIYPNESCPCGSGKKYKKCCGKGKCLHFACKIPENDMYSIEYQEKPYHLW